MSCEEETVIFFPYILKDSRMAKKIEIVFPSVGKSWFTLEERILRKTFEKKSGMLIAHYKRFRIHKVSLLSYTYDVFKVCRFHLDLYIFSWDLRGGNLVQKNTDTLFTAIVNSRLSFTFDSWILCLLPAYMKLWWAALKVWR